MNQIKNIIKCAVGGADPFTKIYYGNPTQQTYHVNLLFYQQMIDSDRETLIEKCFKKLNKEKAAVQILQILHLLDRIVKVSKVSQLNLILSKLRDQTQIYIKAAQKGNKIQIALIHLTKIYYQSFRSALQRDHSIDRNSPQCPLSIFIQDTQIATEFLLSLLQNQFILNYLINYYHKINDKQIQQQESVVICICKHMLVRAIYQMQETINFINKWSYIIFENKQYSLPINYLYQKLISINRDIKKLQPIRKKLKILTQFSKFNFDKQKNTKIEKLMLQRKQECKAFKTQKNIKSRKFIPLPNDNQDDLDFLIEYRQF